MGHRNLRVEDVPGSGARHLAGGLAVQAKAEVIGHSVGGAGHVLGVVVEIELGHIFEPLRSGLTSKACQEGLYALRDGRAFIRCRVAATSR